MGESYGLLVLAEAWRDSKGDLRSHVKTSVVTLAVSATLGTGSGAVTGGFLGAFIGAIGAPLLVGVGLFLWNLVTAPARLRAADQRTIAELRERLAAEPRAVARYSRSSAMLDEADRELVRALNSQPPPPPRITSYGLRRHRSAQRSGEEEIFLEIVNGGSPADFHAEISLEGPGGTVRWPTGQRFAEWSNHSERTVRIPKDGRAMLPIARLEMDGHAMVGHWTFLEWCPPPTPSRMPSRPGAVFVYAGEPGAHRADSSFIYTVKDTQHEAVMRVTLYAEPAMHGGPQTVSVRFCGPTAEIVERVPPTSGGASQPTGRG